MCTDFSTVNRSCSGRLTFQLENKHSQIKGIAQGALNGYLFDSISKWLPAVTANFVKLFKTAGSFPFNSSSMYLYSLSNSGAETEFDDAFSTLVRVEYPFRRDKLKPVGSLLICCNTF